MLIVLVASGTRGDVQPMIALGNALRTAGYHIRIVAGSNFTGWIESFGLEAHPTVDIEALMRSESGIQWAESRGPLQQLKCMKEIMNGLREETVRETLNGVRGANLILGGFVSEPLLVSIQEKFGTPLMTVALQPYRATRTGEASILSLLPRRNSILNLAMGKFTERMTWSISEQTVADLRNHLRLPPQSVGTYLSLARKIKALYAFSRHVVSPPSDVNAETTGYWFLDEPFTPPDDLLRFIESGEAPIYIGFGSMPTSNPAQIVQLVSETSRRVRRRVLLARGWSSVPELPVFDDNVFVLEHAPHHWLFPRMSAVVHHGGAGTTAAAIRAGVPSVIVPHLGDQPYWGRRVYELGIGTKPLPRHQLNAKTLADRLQLLLKDSELRARAASLGKETQSEQGIETAVRAIQKSLQK